jgi:hypothetical protein
LLQKFATVPTQVTPFGEQGIEPSRPLPLLLVLPEDESGIVNTSGNVMSSVASLGPLLLPPLLLMLPLLPPELEPPLPAPELPPEAPLLLLEALSPFSPPSVVNPPLFVPLLPRQAATIAARDVAGQAQESQVRTQQGWHRALRNQRKVRCSRMGPPGNETHHPDPVRAMPMRGHRRTRAG